MAKQKRNAMMRSLDLGSCSGLTKTPPRAREPRHAPRKDRRPDTKRDVWAALASGERRAVLAVLDRWGAERGWTQQARSWGRWRGVPGCVRGIG